MANEPIKMKTGLISSIEKDENTGISPVNIQAGTIYFAVDDNKKIGKILYDVDSTHRVVMSTEAEYADRANYATLAGNADLAKALVYSNTIDGVEFNGSKSIQHFGICSTAAATAAKTINCTGFKLVDGARITVKWTNTNSAANPTLNVQNTGAKPIWYRGSAISAGYLAANRVQEFIYNSTSGAWEYVGDVNTNTTYTVATTSKDGLMSAADKTKLETIATNATHVILSATTPIAVSAATGAVNITHATSGPSSTANTSKGDTSNQTPAFGGTFKVTSETVDSFGHTTALADHTVKIPDTTASDSNNGLMSSSMYSKLVGIEAGAQVNTVTGVKGNSESTYRTGNINITKANIGLGNVENKSSATIRSELTSSNVTTALGYTPATQDPASDSADGLLTASLYSKLIGIASGAEVNQNAFSNIKVGSTTIAADAKTDTVEFVGSNVTLTPDATNDKLTIGITKANVTSALGYTPPTTNTTYGVATTSKDGLMSAGDKAKLDAGITIAGNALNIGGSLAADTLRTSLGLSNAMHFIGKATVDITDGSTTNPTITGYDFANNKKPGDVVIDKNNSREYIWTAAGAWEELGPDGSYSLVDHTHATATSSNDGFMSAAQAAKLAGIAAGATAVSFSRSLSSGTKIGTITINGTATDLYSTPNTWIAFKGATASAAGTAGYINAVPAAGDTGSYFGSDGAWHGNATTGSAGLMSAADKTKLEGISANARPGTVTSVATGVGLTGGTITASGTIKVKLRSETALTNDSAAATETAGRIYPVVPDKTGYLAVNVPWVNTTYNNASASAAGLMSAAHYSKLEGIATGATNTTISATGPISASASTGAVTISHDASGVTAQAYGETGNKTPGFGSTFSVPSFTVDTTGHVTVAGSHTVKIPNATASANAAGLMSSSHYSKIEGIAAGAQVNVIESVKMNGTALTISSKSVNIPVMGAATADAAGTVGVVPAPAKGKQTSFLRGDGTWVVPTNTTYNNATTSTAGLMSAADKAKLDGIAAGAKVGTVTSVATGAGLTGGTITSSGTVKANLRSETKLTNDSAAATETAGRVYPVALDKTGYLAVNVPWVNTTYNDATASTHGLMTAAHYSKLEGITAGATKTTISATSPIVASASTGAVTLTHATSGPSTTASTSKGDTSNQAPGFGGTFKVTSATVDKYGHTTAFAEHTVTIPSTAASSSTAGLMSAAHYSKLEGIASGATANTGTVTKITAGTGLNTSANQAESATKGSITTTGTLYLTKSGATAGTYGPSAAATTGTNTVNIPYITVDAYGRVTSISNRTYAGVNTDVQVTQLAAITTAGEYPMILGGTTTTGSYTGAVNKIAKVTANPSTGTVSATKFRVAEEVTLEYNSTTKSLDFIFA